MVSCDILVSLKSISMLFVIVIHYLPITSKCNIIQHYVKGGLYHFQQQFQTFCQTVDFMRNVVYNEIEKGLSIWKGQRLLWTALWIPKSKQQCLCTSWNPLASNTSQYLRHVSSIVIVKETRYLHSQIVPVYPGRQVHVASLMPSVQAAPFWHGSGSQSLMLTEISKDNLCC